MVAVASTATTNCTGLLENWERTERRKGNNSTEIFIPLSFTVRRSLSHLASCNLMTLSVRMPTSEYQATLRPVLQISETKNGKITGDLVALRIMPPPHLPVTIYFSVFSNSSSCILSMFCCAFSGRMCSFHLTRHQNPNKLFAIV